MVVAFVANTDDKSQALADAVTAKNAAEQTAALRQTQLAAQQDKESQRIKDLKSESQQLQSKVTTLTSGLANAEAQSADLRGRIGTLDATIARLSAAEQQLATINK